MMALIVYPIGVWSNRQAKSLRSKIFLDSLSPWVHACRREGETMKFPYPVVRIANAITMAALIAGIPRPPYNRGNALIVETRGRRSGKRRRLPVGYLDDGGRIIVVVEDGTRAQWVQNALAD